MENQSFQWLYAPGWLAFAVADYLSTPAHPDSLGGLLIGKLPAIMGVLLGFAHWYTNQRDRKTQIRNSHELKLIEAKTGQKS